MIGTALLVGALIVTPFATYTTFILVYAEENTLSLHNNSFKIPQKKPVNLMISFNQYVTYLKASVNGGNCSSIKGSIEEITAQKTYPLYCGKTVELKTSGIEVFALTLNSIPKYAGKLQLMYNYTVYEAINPYSYLTYVGLFLSLGGASAGVLGVVLMIKKKILEKAEEKYLK